MTLIDGRTTKLRRQIIGVLWWAKNFIRQFLSLQKKIKL
jgi:hypothetical protein